MKQNAIRLAALACITLVIALFGPTLFLGGGAVRFGCPLAVNAQDNPCVAQDATIHYLEGALLQATLDRITYDSSLVDMQGQVSTDSADASMFFTETFDNNDRGWRLFSTEDQAVSLSQGGLRLVADGGYPASVQIPNLNADSYFVEFQVTPYSDRGFIGLIVGDWENQNFQYLQFGSYGYNWIARPAEFTQENGSVRGIESTISTNESDYWDDEGEFTMSFELRNGALQLFYNGNAIEGMSPVYGNQIGISIYGVNGPTEFKIDNVVVRQSR